MKPNYFTQEQIVKILEEAEAGTEPIADLARQPHPLPRHCGIDAPVDARAAEVTAVSPRVTMRSRAHVRTIPEIEFLAHVRTIP